LGKAGFLEDFYYLCKQLAEGAKMRWRKILQNQWPAKEVTAILLLRRPCFFRGLFKKFATEGRKAAGRAVSEGGGEDYQGKNRKRDVKV